MVDRFTEISAERFRGLDAGYCERSALFFPYRNYSPEFPPVAIGLWLSSQYTKKQIETAHYIPDSDCQDALKRSRAYCGNDAVWLGLFVEVDSDTNVNLTLPRFLLENYSTLAFDQEIPLKVELEERYGVQIETQ